MLGLVNDLVDLYLIQNGNFKVKTSAAMLSTCLNDIYNIVSLQAQEKNITIDIKIDESLKEEVLLFDDLRIGSII